MIKYRPFSNILDSFFSDWDEWFNFPMMKMQEVEFRTPLMDLKEDEKAYTLTMELPGMKKEDIKIEITNDRNFEIRGERKEEVEEKDEDGNYLRRERSHRSFYRSFRLPTKVDTKKVEAKVENGVLTVNIPKMEPKEEPKTTVEIK